MNINEIIENKKLSKYALSKRAGVPYATLSDICSGKSDIKKCSAETVYRLAKELSVSMEELLNDSMEHRPAFELFKSDVCHRLKELGDIDFLTEVLENNEIELYFYKKWFPESLYLLAMLDYISRVNNVPLCDKYDYIRKTKLKSIIYPSSVIARAMAEKNKNVEEDAIKNSIPEFIRFNIVESEVRNVV